MDTEQHISELGLANSAAVLHPAGTVMLCRTASVGLFCQIGRPMATTQAFVTWTPGPRLDGRYLLYTIAAMRPEFDRLAYGSTHLTIYMPDLEALRIPLPPVEEQRRIADFLDDQVESIDALVDLRRHQIRLVSEQFLGIRTKALRGPGPTRAMGGWLGEVSTKWRVRRLGSVARVHAGAGFPLEYQGQVQGDLPFVKVGDLSGVDGLGVLVDAESWVSNETARILGAKVAPPGTVLLPKVGAALLTNRRAVLGRDAVFDNNVMGLRFPEGDASFALHLLSEVDMAPLANPGPVPSLNADAVRSVLIPWPEEREQERISHLLEEAWQSRTFAIGVLEEQVGLLEERKRALITAAVTGKLDVTTAKPIGMGKWVSKVGASLHAPAVDQTSGIGEIG